MKKLIASICCCAMLAPTLFTQDSSDSSKQEWKKQTAEKSANQYMGSGKIVGAYIYGPKDETVGDVNSIVLNKDGKIMHAIVGVGGVAGVGETEIAVPWAAFGCECEMEDGKKCCRATLPMTAEQLKKAPKLEAAEYAEMYDQNWLRKNAEFYGADTSVSAPARDSLMCVTDVSGLQLTGDKMMETAKSDENQQTHTSSDSDRDADLGTIEEVVFDVAKSKACYVIVGDNSGLVNERHVAVPFSQVKFSKNDGEYCAKVAATSKDLKAAPEVTPGEYKELDLESVRERVDSSFASR